MSLSGFNPSLCHLTPFSVSVMSLLVSVMSLARIFNRALLIHEIILLSAFKRTAREVQ